MKASVTNETRILLDSKLLDRENNFLEFQEFKSYKSTTA